MRRDEYVVSLFYYDLSFLAHFMILFEGFDSFAEVSLDEKEGRRLIEFLHQH